MSFDLQPVLSANAQTVLANRYLHKNEKGEATEVPRDMFERVARAIAAGDAEYGEDPHLIAPTFYEMMVRGLFLPNTPCLANAGRPGSTGQLAACFVLPVDDDMRSIMGSVSAAAFIQQSGGGTGFSFSRLRPNGDFVRSTSGVASGPISFMSMFNSMTEHVKQGGIRRGANMGILRVDHPDIMEFIDCKRKACAVCASNGALACDHSIKNFNISVGITDAFMAALTGTDSSYDLVNPRTGLVTGRLKAKLVWARIVDNAHFSGEPGLCFLDRVNRLDPLTAALGPIEATNPCQPAWATVLTPDGIRKLEDVSEGSTIWSGKRWTKIVRKVATGIKPVLAYRTRAGTFYGTENHRVVQAGRKIEVRAAEGVDIALGGLSAGGKLSGDDVLAGLLVGDGTFHKASGRVFLIAGPDEIGEYRADALLGEGIGVHRPGVKDTAYEVIDCPFVAMPLTYEREVPDDYLRGTDDTMRGFLRGLYTANGSVVGNRVTLKASSFKVIEGVQQMLSALGIASYYTVNKAHDVEHANGVYMSRESYDLNIGNVAARVRFAQLIGFIHKHKTERLATSLEVDFAREPKATYGIVEIEEMGEEQVFDITVDADEHTYWTGGLLVSNCGEVPLRAYDACTLGSINLSNFYVRNPKKACGTIDFDQLRTIVYHAIHFLDNVLTVNKFPVPEIAEMTRTCRKVGLGVMGWADLLIKLDIPYDSQPAIDLAEQVGRFVNTEAVAASEYLAEIRGPFAHWSKSAWALRGDKPRRNATATVIAPTGSISIIAGCSSGIEPLFALKMKRNHAVLQADDSCALFDEHVRENYEGAQLSSVLEWVAEHGTVRDCPHAMAETAALFPTAMGIDGDWHVRMQAAWQQHVEDAVSKTINLPKTATPEDVARSYQMAWDLGCKGITVYRDGSRQQQVLSAGNGQSAVASVAPLWAREHRRIPEDGWREGPTISRSTAFGSVHTTINTHPDDGEPFECFASLGRGGSEVTAFAAALGRANSLLLSIPSPLSPRDRLALLAAQLKGIGGTQNGYGDKKTASIPDAISQAISQYLARYSVVVPVKQALDICPDCKQATLAKGGKCDVCTSCGFSKC